GGPRLFSGCRRGYRDYTEAKCPVGTSRLQAIRILTLEPERLKNRSATPRGKITGDGKGSSPRRSSGLRVQFIDVEIFSLLPQCQRNGCNLACQGEAHHGGLDAFGERALVKLRQGSGLYTGRRNYYGKVPGSPTACLQQANTECIAEWNETARASGRQEATRPP